jgi:5,10-methylenetetrahydromethanopterin reductase|tara:strand:- start:14955 stop:15962 length:1008 start_codon:yes stop_codon:yes gene_type:complete
VEFWTSHPSAPTRAADVAAGAERHGWDGLTTVDSQNLSGDPYVFLALAATGSDRLGLQTSVTNPVTRVAAATATSAMSVQKLSKGRMIVGIGRGDSALAHLGRSPAKLKWFEDYLVNLQTYLRGDEVAFEHTGILDQQAAPVENLGLADAPSSSSIQWAVGIDKVPVEVAATGEKVIGMAARHSDRIMFALGADSERLRWGIDIALEAASKVGKDPDSLKFGAYINIVCHHNLAVARDLGRAGTSLFALFSVMHGSVSGPASEKQQEVFRTIHDSYDMNMHVREGSQQSKVMTDEFMDEYAVIGGVEYCIERLQEIEKLGISKVSVAGPSFTAKS